jgi:hypothetical protein
VITYLKIGAIALDRSQDIPEKEHNWRGRRKQELVIASSFTHSSREQWTPKRS